MLIIANRPAVAPTYAARPQAALENLSYLAPGDAYVPSMPSAFSLGVSGTALGMIAGGGTAALISNLADGFGGPALAIGLVVAGGIGGAFAGTKAFEAFSN